MSAPASALLEVAQRRQRALDLDAHEPSGMSRWNRKPATNPEEAIRRILLHINEARVSIAPFIAPGGTVRVPNPLEVLPLENFEDAETNPRVAFSVIPPEW